MYTLDIGDSVGVVQIRFAHVKDHRALPVIPTNVNLFRVSRATLCRVGIQGSWYSGYSFCSWLDPFNTEKGKIRALKDALIQTHLTREQRATVWTAFFAAKPDREHKKRLIQAEVMS